MTIELTINGKTKTFENGKEAAEWMEKMRAVKPKNKRRKRKRANKSNLKHKKT